MAVSTKRRPMSGPSPWLWKQLWNRWIVCSTILSLSASIVICAVEEVVTWHVDPALLLPAPGTGQQCCLKNVFNGIVLFLPVYGHCYGHIPSLQSPNCYHLSSTWGCMKIISLHCSSSHASRHCQNQMVDNVNTKCCKKTNVQSLRCSRPRHYTEHKQMTRHGPRICIIIPSHHWVFRQWWSLDKASTSEEGEMSAWQCMMMHDYKHTNPNSVIDINNSIASQVEMFLGTTPLYNCKLQISKWYVYIFHIFLAIC